MSNSVYLTRTAGGALSKYTLVKIDGSNEVTTAGATDTPWGVVQVDAVSGDAVNICVSGLTSIVSAGVITLGTDNNVMAAANGQAQAYNGAGVGTQHAIGHYKHNATAAANDEVLIDYRGLLAQG